MNSSSLLSDSSLEEHLTVLSTPLGRNRDETKYFSAGNGRTRGIISSPLLQSENSVGKEELCELHSSPLVLFCSRDLCKICEKCVIYGPHKEHGFKMISDLMAEYTAQKSKSQELIKSLEKNRKDSIFSSEETGVALRNRIQPQIDAWFLKEIDKLEETKVLALKLLEKIVKSTEEASNSIKYGAIDLEHKILRQLKENSEGSDLAYFVKSERLRLEAISQAEKILYDANGSRNQRRSAISSFISNVSIDLDEKIPRVDQKPLQKWLKEVGKKLKDLISTTPSGKKVRKSEANLFESWESISSEDENLTKLVTGRTLKPLGRTPAYGINYSSIPVSVSPGVKTVSLRASIFESQIINQSPKRENIPPTKAVRSTKSSVSSKVRRSDSKPSGFQLTSRAKKLLSSKDSPTTNRISKLISNINKSTLSIAITGVNLTDIDLVALTRQAKFSSKITDINFSNNELTSDGLSVLLNWISSSEELKTCGSLTLKNNKIDKSGIEMLNLFVSSQHNMLHDVDLRANPIIANDKMNKQIEDMSKKHGTKVVIK